MYGNNLNTLGDQLKSIQSQLAQYRPQPVPMTPIQAPAMPTQQPLVYQQIQYVDGIEGARQFQTSLAPNSSAIVMDKNGDMFYFLTKDANGVAPELITIGDFTLRQEERKEPVYVTKQDLEDLKAEIRELLSKKDEVNENEQSA